MTDTKPLIKVLKKYELSSPPHMMMIVNSIAEDYRRDVKTWSTSHRITDVISDLQDIALTANRLGVVLRDLHPQTFQAMGGDWRLPGQLSPMDLDKVIEHSVLDDLSTENKDRESAGIMKNILDLAKLASTAKDELKGTWKFRREDGKLDAGGNEIIASMTRDHPKLVLARSCRQILIKEFKAKITGHQNGLFYDFFAAVFEYASGQDPESKGAGLERYVKQVIKESRQRP